LIYLLGHHLGLHGEWLGIWLETLLTTVSLEGLGLTGEVHWARHKVLVWIEPSESSEISKVCDWDQWGNLGLKGVHACWIEAMRLTHHWCWSHHAGVIIIVIFVSVSILVGLVGFVFLQLFWHWWKSDSFRKVWKWVDELSSLLITVEE
jgi:hypothetical protein